MVRLHKRLWTLVTIIHIFSSLPMLLVMYLLPQYFVAIEQQLRIECKNLERAIFTMLAAHYIFNMEYHPMVKNVFYLLQEKVFELPDTTFKKSAIYLSVSSAIDLYL